MVGGVVTPSPLVINKIFTIGVKVVSGVAKAEFKNFVRAFVLKVVLEKILLILPKAPLKKFYLLKKGSLQMELELS